MYTVIVQTEEDFQQLTKTEKEQAIVLTVSQKDKLIKQLIQGFK